MKAVINNEARYVSQYPYCGAFQPPPESGLAPTHNDWADGVTVNPYVSDIVRLAANLTTSPSPVNNLTVFECKVSSMRICGLDVLIGLSSMRLTPSAVS